MTSSRTIARAVYELAQDSANKNIAENLAQYLDRNNLMPLLGSVVQHLEYMHRQASARTKLDIVSAYTLPKDTVQDIKKSLGAEHLGSVQEDKDLLGGFIAEYNGVVYDASIKTQLTRLKNNLTS
ncbi:MAG: F0F1 ATP synthase subunit delta [Candidatus Pacebacteria bacterium]|nr:F0F1 ATP synthase subunit delta [Candidatus Paceibacterota bacterium]